MIMMLVPLLAGLTTAAQTAERADGLYAELRTTKGLIVIRLEFEKTPMSVANFVGLAEGTIKNAALPLGTPYYNGSVWHRVVPGHVIQAGQPKGGTQNGPGYTFPNEIVTDPAFSHGRAGMVGMANSGPHTNTSQFYITLADRSYLDGNYTVFGRVVEGMDVVNAIAQGDTIEKVTIVRLGKAAEAIRPDTTSFQKMVDDAKARVKAADDQKARDEERVIAERWPSATTTPTGVKSVVEHAGSGERLAAGAKVTVRYTGQLLDGRPFASSIDSGRPTAGTAAEVFEFVVGTTHVTAGLDEAIADMRVGERRIVIVPASRGYGASGFYAKEKPGEKRFVISPGTTLVYDVEVLALLK
jgi:peptidylprolyl isomerase